MCKLNNEIEVNEYINIQTGEKLDLEKVNALPDNYMLKVKKELWCAWDFKKNNELSFDIWKMTYGMKKKAWWICKKCNKSWECKVGVRIKRINCKDCTKSNVIKKNIPLYLSNPQLASEWHPTKNGDSTPHDVTCGNAKKVWWLGECGHEWDSTIASRNSGCGCPYCVNIKLLVGFNDMWTTNPSLASLLANPEDGYKYMKMSHTKLDWKCLDCGEIIKNKKIQDVNTHGFSCDICNDKSSYPEKLMKSLLKNNSIEFIHNKKLSWSNGRRYDFYIPSLNVIIETHGMQHYTVDFGRGARTLQEEQENDKYKYELAIVNGIKKENYIIIDCRYSDFEFIKNNIMTSRLAEIFNLYDFSWESLNISEKSKVVEAWELWDSGITSTSKIAKILDLATGTVKNYLKRGASLGKCTYTTDTRVKYIQRAVVKLTLDGEFIEKYDSILIASKLNGLKSPSSIGLVCKGKGISCKEYKWMYLDSYEDFLKSETKFLHSINSRFREMVQLDLNGDLIKEWKSIKEASNELNINYNKITSMCKRKDITTGNFICLYKEDYEKFLKGELLLFNENNKSKTNKRIRKVVQLTLNGTIIKQYDSMKDACNELNISSGSLSDACRGVKKTTKGFKWMYLEDYEKTKNNN